jgi:hypothetical protein
MEEFEKELSFRVVSSPQESIDSPIGFVNPNMTTQQEPSFSLHLFQKFFDVSTADVITRIQSAANPLDTKFLQLLSKPDLYGAVWIPATISFIAFACGNLSLWFRSSSSSRFTYNFSSLVAAFFLLNILVFGGPWVLWYCEKRLFPPVVNLIALYGYSLVYIIPSSLATVIVGKFLGFLIGLTFAVTGAVSIARKIQDYQNASDKGVKGRGVMIIAGCLYGLFHLVVHLLCFR